MPPRSVTLAILLFWLGTMGWMAYRDVLPALRQHDGPPPFSIDLTDELSLGEGVRFISQSNRLAAQAVPWRLTLQNKRIGYALTTVQRHKDRTFDLRAELHFNDDDKRRLQIPLPPPLEIDVSSVTSSYHVTAGGDLLGLTVSVVLIDQTALGARGPARSAQINVGLEAEVEGGQLVPHVFLYERAVGRRRGKEEIIKTPLGVKLRPVPVPERGAVLNTLQPLNRLAGLRAGQSWRVPRFDPLDLVMAALGTGGPPQTHYLSASVGEDTLSWARKEVPCWRIDYAEPGRHIAARTWVRKSDGLVLRQEARHDRLEMALTRGPS